MTCHSQILKSSWSDVKRNFVIFGSIFFRFTERITIMNFGRVIFKRAVKLCSKSSSWIRCNKNVANFCNGIPATKVFTDRFINRREYCTENGLKSLNRIEVENFDETFPLIVENLTNEDDVQDERIKDVFVRFKEILENTVFTGRRVHGKVVVSTYKLLANSEDLTQENIQLANILGWCVEMMVSFLLILDDIMDQSTIRRGKPCWFRNEHVGFKAINDATMVESGIFYILRKHFKNLPSYIHIVEAFHDVIRFIAIGQTLDVIFEHSPKSSKFELFTQDVFETTTIYKTACYSFIFPIKIALYLAGRTNENFENARQLLLKMGECYQVKEDYLDCFGDPAIIGKRGTDIEGGKFTWPIVTALKTASEEQIAILRENYGVWDENSVRKVKEVYNELELPKLYEQYREETFRKLTMLIDDVGNSTPLPSEVFQLYMKMLYKKK